MAHVQISGERFEQVRVVPMDAHRNEVNDKILQVRFQLVSEHVEVVKFRRERAKMDLKDRLLCLRDVAHGAHAIPIRRGRLKIGVL